MALATGTKFSESGHTIQVFVGLQFEGGTSLKICSDSSTSQTNEETVAYIDKVLIHRLLPLQKS